MGIQIFPQFIILFVIITTNAITCNACLGAWVTTFPPPPPISTSALALSRNRVLAAPNYNNQQPDDFTHSIQCATVEPYKASELRALSTLYSFPTNVPSLKISDSSTLTCSFDSIDESCAWYTVTFEILKKIDNDIENNNISLSLNQNAVGFRRARFESFFDLERFICTSERFFTFDNFFLLTGGQKNSPSEFSTALEAQLPCQPEKGVLKFDFWSNNETPVLKICVLLEENLIPHCEESKMDTNPLTFEIPSSMNPFRIRILIENIGHHDIVFIDNISYQGTICQSSSLLTKTEIIKKTPVLQTLTPLISSSTLSLKHPVFPIYKLPFKFNDNDENNLFVNNKKIEEDSLTSLITEHVKNEETLYNNEIELNTKKKNNLQNEQKRIKLQKSNAIKLSKKISACQALSCNFNFDNSCFYYLNGLGATSSWKIGKNSVGNSYTGIHRPNPNDLKLNGFAYVTLTKNEFSEEVFVMESKKFKMFKPAYLVFDLFQRSIGPELKICINEFNNCPYSSPPLKTTRHWHLNQHLKLNLTAEKIYFIAGNLRQNQYLAVDNIRLLGLNGENDCLKQ